MRVPERRIGDAQDVLLLLLHVVRIIAYFRHDGLLYCRVVSKSGKFGYDPFVPLLSRTLYRPAFCLPDVDAPVEDSAPRALRYSMTLLRDPSMSLESMDFE